MWPRPGEKPTPYPGCWQQVARWTWTPCYKPMGTAYSRGSVMGNPFCGGRPTRVWCCRRPTSGFTGPCARRWKNSGVMPPVKSASTMLLATSSAPAPPHPATGRRAPGSFRRWLKRMNRFTVQDMPTVSKPGWTGCWSAGCTAWRLARQCLGSRCSRATRTHPRSRWQPWWPCAAATRSRWWTANRTHATWHRWVRQNFHARCLWSTSHTTTPCPPHSGFSSPYTGAKSCPRPP